jgi:hypothetical protein
MFKPDRTCIDLVGTPHSGEKARGFSPKKNPRLHMVLFNRELCIVRVELAMRKHNEIIIH